MLLFGGHPIPIVAHCSLHFLCLGEYITIPARQCPSPFRHKESVSLQILPAEVSSPHTYLPSIMKMSVLPEHKLEVGIGESVGTTGPEFREEAGTERIIWEQVRAKHRW